MRNALLLAALVFAFATAPAFAQTYGTGVEADVPYVEPGTISLDGEMNEEAWENALVVNPANFWSGDWTGHPDPDVGVEARVLYTEDSLFVFYQVEDYAVLFGPNADHAIVGLDFVHEAGVTDKMVDENYGGFGDNAPDGPVTYAVTAESDTIPAFSQSWRTDVVPAEEGWVAGAFVYDEDNLTWGFEAAFVNENVGQGNAIGFNIGGAAAKEEGVADREGELAYAWYSWQVCDENADDAYACGAGGAGGVINANSRSYSTLNLVEPGGGSDYGTGVTATVPRVEPGTITLDGEMNEAAWENALVLNPANFWSGDWTGHPDPDIGVEARLLYTEDRLLVFYLVEDYAVLFGPNADHAIVGLDFVHEAGVTDMMVDENYGGFGENAPDGPVTYAVTAESDTIPAFSQSWRMDVSPVEEGWVEGTFFHDEDNLVWGFEAAFIHENVGQGNAIGFNIGGAAAKEEGVSDREGELAYAWYSWQVCDENADDAYACGSGGAGGVINANSRSYSTLFLGDAVGIEEEKLDEIPSAFALGQNYPNPFNPSTTIEYSLSRAGTVSLDIFNLLGQRVASLVDEPRTAGTYRLTWEAGNLPSGMYVYQLRIDGELVKSRKMMLIK